jgi:hypothetical protein
MPSRGQCLPTLPILSFNFPSCLIAPVSMNFIETGFFMQKFHRKIPAELVVFS